MAKQFLQLFAGTFCISLFVLMMQFLWRYVDDLIGKGLSIDVLAEFFWYMSLMLVPQAMPLAVLLASLITMGNIGENSELTAIKAAGISLVQTLRAMFFCALIVTGVSFYFQNNIGPEANLNMATLLKSMQQKSPELEIPEGIFYDGIPNSNLYVQKKNMETGMLYGIMIYRMNESYEDAAIILADSGMLQSTADKMHLLLTLHNGEWFENMRSQEMAGNANVPYRRETFLTKKIVLDFDSGLNMVDAERFAGNAKTKSLDMISTSIDTLYMTLDSVGKSLRSTLDMREFHAHKLSNKDTLTAIARVEKQKFDIDSVMAAMTPSERTGALQSALNNLQMASYDIEFRKDANSYYDEVLREHYIEAINKFTLALTCLIFFFIGAPLGAIIRKGGLGVPVIVSVLVFIIFYILDNTGYRMARLGAWPIWLGKGLAPGILIPLAVFVTYKANKDSAVFNMDAYRNFFMRLLGLRLKRIVNYKEVIINTPRYAEDVPQLQTITADIVSYATTHKLAHLPNPIAVFFQYVPDHEIERISDQLETVIEDLSNTRDRYMMDYLNRYPILSVKAHTRPFERKWMNITAAIIFPLGIFLYCRMWRFRLRLLHDLRQIRTVNDLVITRIESQNAVTAQE